MLSRVGVSLYYHSGSCPVVSRNRIPAVRTEEVSTALIPCENCSPVPMREDVLYPEAPRYWAQVSSDAEGIVDALYKFDDQQTRYLTNVARRLLEDAARIDDEIHAAYYEEHID